MRRGHPTGGRWRNDNPRHFRRPVGGMPPFRPPRMYSLLDTPRLPIPRGMHPSRGPHYYHGHRPHRNELEVQGHHDRNRLINRYRFINHHNNQHKHQDWGSDHGLRRHEQVSTLLSHPRQPKQSHSITSEVSSKSQDSYYDSDSQVHVNRMGDVDFRQVSPDPATLNQHCNWSQSNPRYNKDIHYQDKAQGHQDMIEFNKTPESDTTSHRPQSSDNYIGTPILTIENSNTFTRSIDDTVNIVRKRLLSRNEFQSVPDEGQFDKHCINKDNKPNTFQKLKQDQDFQQPMKRRMQKQGQNVKLNCNKIKDKIVQELFKMDKTKMHKLMDNPNSSSKFEYAISSLITESQNSLHRHLRSVAEKSLCNSNTAVIEEDNNTIYEDTFMKQMQCILDPQDSVLLEDIKPLVMAELNKVLQLNDLDHKFTSTDNHISYVEDTKLKFEQSPVKESYEFSQDNFQHYNDDEFKYNEHTLYNSDFQTSALNQVPSENSPPLLFERRSIKKCIDVTQDRHNSIQNKRISLNREDNDQEVNATSVGLFDDNTEQCSEEEDPFAELDKQYHVAVDHSFIDSDILSTPTSSTVNTEHHNSQEPNINSYDIKIMHQSENYVNSPLKTATSATDQSKSIPQQDTKKKQEPKKSTDAKTDEKSVEKEIKHENICGSKQLDQDTEQRESSHGRPLLSSNSRKRSTDQRPAHRKEKRKKSDATPESNKQILNKNIIINVNDCSSKSSEKCNAPKSVFNLFFSKNQAGTEVPKDMKDKSAEKNDIDTKYIKRKETPKKHKEKDCDVKKKLNFSTAQHSDFIHESKNTDSQTHNKTDNKIKLRTIDMFLEKPQKILNKHQAHRNTASIPEASVPVLHTSNQQIIDEQPKVKATRSVTTQIHRKYSSKETQTVSCKKHVKSVQTDPIEPEKPKNNSTDTLERMKEIDLEIQELLKEKFKLYNSLESKDTIYSNTILNLGMTVVDVSTEAETKQSDLTENILSEDDIVHNFTAIPVDELEQIAFETVQDEPTISTMLSSKKKRQQTKLIEEKKSLNPAIKNKNIKPKKSSPNISLIEQIITDERPIEDIISLEDLEVTPVTKKKTPKCKGKKSRIKKKMEIKNKTCRESNENNFILKDCSVVLLRTDLSAYFQVLSEELPTVDYYDPECTLDMRQTIIAPNNNEQKVIEDSHSNDLQFDMLDVSEDIVIGDNCDIKLTEDKTDGERLNLSFNEEVIVDNSQSSSDNVVCSDLGQSEHVCKMYDYSSDENLKRETITVTGHADAVLAIECIDNNFIAACLDGNVYYFSEEGQLLSTLRGSNLAVTCLTIVKETYGTTVYTGSLDSRIRYYDLETGLEKGPECNVLSPIQSMDRAWDTVFVGTRTGFVLQFECKNNILIPVSTVKFSDQSILALKAMKEGPRKVLLVAARSDNVTVKDAQTGLLLRTLDGPKMTVYSLLYEDGKVYCGTSSHHIHVFDYSSGSHVGNHEGGKGAVCLRAAGGLLLAGCYDGCVYVYREGETRAIAQLRGPSLMLLSLAIVGSKIIAGYKDRSLYIWRIPINILEEMIL